MRRFLSVAMTVALLLIGTPSVPSAEPLNVLVVTVDDMSADSVGVYGCKLPDTTPHMDALAAESLRFAYAHVQVGNCMPSRNVMWSGRYPHNNGVEGFYQVRTADFPVLADVMHDAGYYTGIRHKVSHSTPYSPYNWDVVLDDLPDGGKAHVKDAASYGESTARGIAAAQAADKPFCLVINIADPHKPFYAEGRGGETVDDPHVPTKVFTPEEVPIPGFLFDDPVVRKELSHYYSSVRRADDALGSILDALDASGARDSTFIMFLSDHGMPLPFAKTQLYHHSTHTPLMIHWPGVTRPGAIDEQHMVSAVDFLPTLCDVIGAPHPEGMDGRSFASVLKGDTQSGRDMVFKVYNENAGRSRDPMRAVQTKRFLYLFNPWSNGERVMATATSGTSTYRRMRQLAADYSQLAERLDLYQHRVVEELYDVQQDPDCLVNLIDAPEHQAELDRLRDALEAQMVATNDHMLETFRNRGDAEAREAYVQAKEAEAEARGRNRNNRASQRRQRRNLIAVEVPESITAGGTVTVTIRHRLPVDLGEQQVHVTFKGGDPAKRIERKVIKVTGRGDAEVTFDVPSSVPQDSVRFAAFVGEDFGSNLQHVQTDPQEVN